MLPRLSKRNSSAKDSERLWKNVKQLRQRAFMKNQFLFLFNNIVIKKIRLVNKLHFVSASWPEREGDGERGEESVHSENLPRL